DGSAVYFCARYAAKVRIGVHRLPVAAYLVEPKRARLPLGLGGGEGFARDGEHSVCVVGRARFRVAIMSSSVMRLGDELHRLHHLLHRRVVGGAGVGDEAGDVLVRWKSSY